MGSVSTEATSHEPNQLPGTTWQHVAAIKQAERREAVRAWSAITLSKAVPELPPASVTNVVRWPAESGQLSARQLEMTESIPSRILEQLASGTWSAEEVLLAFIARATMAHYLTNPLATPLFERGLERARELDAHLKKTGQPVGPLHGLPISVKDVINISGTPTTAGYVALAIKGVDMSDELVPRLMSAGAVFYCKTNIPQSLMSGECNNNLYGRTSCPHNLTLSAGGSSGGEGSLVALGGSPIGIGTDIAGSIRTPANFNGVYGLCPTFRRLPLHSPELSYPYYQINPVAGPLSRSIDGLEVYVQNLLATRPWEWDFQCERLPWDQAAYDQVMNRAATGDLCIGFVANDGVVTPHPPIQRGMREVREALVRSHVRVVDVEMWDGTEGMWEIVSGILYATGNDSILNLINQVQEPVLKETVLRPDNRALTLEELFALGRRLHALRQRHLERWERTRDVTGTGRPVDFLILPSGAHVAPPHGTMDYFLYEAISNAVDTTCATIPIGNVSLELDPRPADDASFTPLSELDRRNWDKYTPELYLDGPICLQVMGPRFSEEKVIAALRVINKALGRPQDHIM